MGRQMGYHPLALSAYRSPPYSPCLGLGQLPNERAEPLALLACGRLQGLPVLRIEADAQCLSHTR